MKSSKLTAGEFSDLKTIAANLENGMTTSSYLDKTMIALVDGNAANATWTGGAAAATSLGNLAVGATATQLAELDGKWFLGTDLPSSTVTMGGSSFSVSYSASASPLFAATGPSMNDINQGDLGDCYFLSCLAEVADKNSGIISSMFTSNGNNTYGVRFYDDGVAEYVTVNNDLADGGNVFNSATNIWASLAETAYAEAQPNLGGFFNSFSSIGNGGYPAAALEAITGASAITDFSASGSSWQTEVMNSSLDETGYSSGASTASILSVLIADLAKGDDADLSSNTNAKDSSGHTTLVADHALSIYGFDNVTGLLEIRNPWGAKNAGGYDATFEVSLSALLTDGDEIDVDNVGTGAAAAPVLTLQTQTQMLTIGKAGSFALSPTAFTDPQGEKLTYSATLSSGAALPSWLSFNAATETFAGTAPVTAAGLNLEVTARNTSGVASSETFSLLTLGGAAPVLTAQTANQTWKLGQAVSFTLPSNTFTDPRGETLGYGASLYGGAALPSWLSFNYVTGSFTGTVPNTATGLKLSVYAYNTSCVFTSETFSVLTPASAPTVTNPTAGQTWKLGQSVSFTLPSTTFTDPQAEKLTYSAALSSGAALPSWLSFNAASDTFTGTVPNTATGLNLKVTATDASGLAASESFSVLTPATAPTVTNPTATQTWKGGQAVSFALPSNTFTDPQSEKLTFSATLSSGAVLPSWLQFNGATDTFTGTAPATAQTLGLKLTASDTSGLSGHEIFNVSITAAAAKVAAALAFSPGSSSGTASLYSPVGQEAVPTLVPSAH